MNDFDDFNAFAALMDDGNPPPRKLVDIDPGRKVFKEVPQRIVCDNTGFLEAAAEFVETCPKCNGTGSFRAYTGRILGQCFKCKGRGTQTFKTSPEARRKAKLAAGKRAQAKIESEVLVWETWCEAHRDVYEYLLSRADRWDFAASLLEGGRKFGELTERQLAAAERAMARDAVPRETQPTSGLDLSSVPSGMYAVPDGTRLKLRIRHVAKGKWKGWTFVDDGAEYGHRQNYGKQRPGGTYTGKCLDQLTAIAADPKAAMAAYGHLTSQCGVCGRHLEDEESVARGIGPVCAKKFG